MSYTVKSSEKTKKTGSDYETKALLYLMNFRSDSDEIHYFVVDFFNDLTGMDRMASDLWDLQSKGAKNVSPKVIGQELVTLFKNYLSDIEFKTYILFMGGVSDSVRVDNTQNVFDYSNIIDASKKKIAEGLKEECNSKTYIDSSKATDEAVASFLNKVTFVIDDKKPSEYVKAIIKEHPSLYAEESILDLIFSEIRKVQSDKKNINIVEGVVIETTSQALNYYRHLTSNDIKLLALNRIINWDPLSKGIPPSFIPIYSAWPVEGKKDMYDECVQSLCRALFNKNAADGFWELLEQIYSLILKNPNQDVEFIFEQITEDSIKACPDFNALSLKYFISTVKDGIQQ